MQLRLTLLLGLAACPLIGLAQTARFRPTWYTGLSGSHLASTSLSTRPLLRRPFGVTLTEGVQLTPRWAVQVSPGMHWTHQTFINHYALSLGASTDDYNADDVRTSYLSVPVLARYTFTAPTSRLHVEALGGGMLLCIFSRSNFSTTTAGLVTYQRESIYRTTDYFLSLGPSLRYPLSSTLAISAAAPVHYQLTGALGNQLNDRLLLNLLLGITSTFAR